MLRGELQRTADAAALAGASQLPDVYDVFDQADAYRLKNPAHGLPPGLSALTLGRWDFDTRTFAPGHAPFNAVRVAVEQSVSHHFAAIFGLSESTVSAEAIAVGPAPRLRFLIDDEMFDSDVPAIEELGRQLNMDPESELLRDNNGDGFIDMPGGVVLELPTGQVGDEGLFDVSSEFPYRPDSTPSLEDFLRDLIPQSSLDPLVGVDPLSDPGRYPEFVNPDEVLVSPIWKSDVSDTEPWVNARGERRGLVAFKILALGADPPGSYLPNLVIEIVSPSEVNTGDVVLGRQLQLVR